MFAHKRQDYIIEEIKKNGRVKVEELAKELDVSLMTIRRDLQQLSELGWIERCHGGAVTKNETPYQQKREDHSDEKTAIARKALQFIHNGDIVFLDAGTTTFQLLQLLTAFKELIIVTNDLEIGHYASRMEFEVIICGGTLQKATACMLGRMTNNAIASMKYDVAFLGAATIDSKFDVLTPTEQKAAYKQIIVENSNYSYLLVDSSKFHRKAMMRINHLQDYTGVITTYQFDEEEQEQIQKEKVHVIQA